jgi:hypothetical protein
MSEIKKVLLPVDEDSSGMRKSVNPWGEVEREPTALDRLKELSVTNRISEMEANMQKDTFIFPDLALSGQITLFYAWPNTGKTIFFLRFIRDAIHEGRVNGDDVFYINADDSYKGLFTKAKLAEKFGFDMISPSEANVKPQDILKMVSEIASEDDAAGKVILLDTLKKFADMMSKNSQAELYETLRRFNAKGGTAIIAGHANKHKSADGNLIYEGTSDTMNDVDCVYSMYRMSDPQEENQIVEFRREKDRGDVVAKASYQYCKDGSSYIEMLNSISRIDDDEAQQVVTDRRNQELRERYETERLFVTTLIHKRGLLNETEIVKARKENGDLSGEISERGLKTALKKLTGICWTVKRGENHAKVYNLMGAGARDYQKASSGE